MQTLNFNNQFSRDGAGRKYKVHQPTRRLLHFLVVAIGCLAAGLVLGQQGHSDGVLSKKRETINGIPTEYGRLVAVDRSTKDTTMYFEAQDGTIRLVSVIYGIDQGSLTFKAVTVPRS